MLLLFLHFHRNINNISKTLEVFLKIILRYLVATYKYRCTRIPWAWLDGLLLRWSVRVADTSFAGVLSTHKTVVQVFHSWPCCLRFFFLLRS